MSKDAPFTVLLADDHPLVLRGLVELMAGYDDFVVIAFVADGEAALDAIRARQPELSVLDVTMPRLTGTEVLRAVQQENLPTRVVFLTATLADDQILDAVARGVFGIVLKESAPETLIDCLNVVARGGKWLPTELVNAALGSETKKRDAEGVLERALTSREIEIVRLAVTGLPNKLIARNLSLTEGTIKLHLYKIYRKLGVNNRTELAALAFNPTGRGR